MMFRTQHSITYNNATHKTHPTLLCTATHEKLFKSHPELQVPKLGTAPDQGQKSGSRSTKTMNKKTKTMTMTKKTKILVTQSTILYLSKTRSSPAARHPSSNPRWSQSLHQLTRLALGPTSTNEEDNEGNQAEAHKQGAQQTEVLPVVVLQERGKPKHFQQIVPLTNMNEQI